jgi:hypothetical protein
MRRASLLLLSVFLCACDEPATWQVVYQDLPGALLSVWGTSARDVWSVGADVGDGTAWERLDSGHVGTLWWVFGFEGGPIYMGGEGGAILRYEGGTFTPMSTPGTNTVFGIWGASPTDVWAVGGVGTGASDGFAWRLEGDAWVEEPSLPPEVPGEAAIWKVSGRSADDVWLVGSAGVSLHWDGSALTRGDTGVGASLFTVSANADRFAAVGGAGNGIIVEHEDGAWHNMTPEYAPTLSGVVLGAGETGFAVGAYGTVLSRDASGWTEEATSLAVDQNLHAVWLDPEGGVWAAGGQTVSLPLTEGVLIHRGTAVPPGAP